MICGESFTVNHSLNCKCGGFPSIRHNELRDITADLLSEVCDDVSLEPSFQRLSGESLVPLYANSDDQARSDISARGFWSSHQLSYFDVRVYNPFATCYKKSSLASCHRKHEGDKRQVYEDRVLNVEHGSFTPLIFTTAGGLGPAATTFYKRLVSLLAIKRNQSYSQVLHWIRCRINFSLIRSAVMCLRGARSSSHHLAGLLTLPSLK